jgi:CelD/BcsL family acetyltransferase involved in cellulose biosynthesis
MDAVCVPLDQRSERVRDVIAEWQGLTRAAPPILAAEFFCATARWLVEGEPLLMGARAGGRLVAALPLVQAGDELRALASDHSPRFDLAGEAGALPALWRAVAALPGWHVLALDEVPAASPLATALVDLAERDGCLVAVHPGGRSPYMPLGDFESGLRGRFRRNLRSRARKLPGLAFERLSGADSAALDRALEQAFALEAAAWKADAGSAIQCDDRLRGFYGEIARRFAATGRLSLSFLRVHDRRIAVHIAVEDASTYYLLKPGYDPEYSASGPGHLLVERAAVDARARGLGELDFLGREMAWKAEWTARAREHVSVRVYRPSLVGRVRFATEQKIRPAVGWLLRRAGLRRPWEPPRSRHE